MPASTGSEHVESRGVPSGPTVLERWLAASRYLVSIGSLATIVLAGAVFVWAVIKAESFLAALFDHQADDVALVKLFESIDVVLIGTVLLSVGLGLWGLFISELELPPALTVTSFDQLKSKVATTLVLVLVVRFLERLVSAPAALDLLYSGISVTLVGGLLLVINRGKG